MFGSSTKPPSILDKQQQQIFKGINKSEKKAHGDLKDVAIDRITKLYLEPKLGSGISSRDMARRAENLYQACKRTLRSAPLTTNLEVKVFLTESFYLGDGLASGWRVQNAKPPSYWTTRQKVEENAFGYKIDWSIKISEAAKARPAYAGLNFSSHPYGAAAAYGAMVLHYKSVIRERCTFIATDTFDNKLGFTGDDAAKIAEARRGITTLARIGNLCATISDRQLKALCQVAESVYQISEESPNYIEAHIHGPVVFARDLAAITIATSGVKTFDKECQAAGRNVNTVKYLIGSFAERFGVRASLFREGLEIEVLHPG